MSALLSFLLLFCQYMLCHTGVTVAVLILVLLADLSSAQGRSWRSIYMNMNIIQFMISTTFSGIMRY